MKKLRSSLCVGSASINRWVRLRKQTGSVEPKKRGGGNKSPVTDELLPILVEVAQELDNATDQEIAEEFTQRTGISISRSTARRALLRISFTRKKSIYGQ